MEGHGSDVASAVFGPDGRTVLTASHDGTIRLWNAQTTRQIGITMPLSDGWVTLQPPSHRESDARQEPAAFGDNGRRPFEPPNVVIGGGGDLWRYVYALEEDKDGNIHVVCPSQTDIDAITTIK